MAHVESVFLLCFVTRVVISFCDHFAICIFYSISSYSKISTCIQTADCNISIQMVESVFTLIFEAVSALEE